MKRKLVQFLRLRSVSRLWGWCSVLVVRCLGPKTAARLTYWGIDWGDFNPQRPTILCLSRYSFEKDIEELRKRSPFNFVSVLGGYVRFQRLWFPEEMQVQSFYQIYNGPGREQAIAKSFEYANELLRLVGLRSNVRALLSANFDYWQDMGFKQVCAREHVPFLVLSREHLTIPNAYSGAVKWYLDSAYRFEGDAIAVAGPQTLQALLDVGHVTSPDRIEITGLPRMDAWLEKNVDKNFGDRKNITLITYTKGYYADANFTEVLIAFASLSLRFRSSDVCFLVKCKDYDDYCDVNDRLAKTEHNLEVTFDRPLFDLLPDSRIAIGFNSLALIEAVRARCKVVVPYWGECRIEPGNQMYAPANPVVSACISFAKSVSEIETHLQDAVSGKGELLSPELSREFVNQYYYVPKDQSCSEVFTQFLLKHINGDRI